MSLNLPSYNCLKCLKTNAYYKAKHFWEMYYCWHDQVNSFNPIFHGGVPNPIWMICFGVSESNFLRSQGNINKYSKLCHEFDEFVEKYKGKVGARVFQWTHIISKQLLIALQFFYISLFSSVLLSVIQWPILICLCLFSGDWNTKRMNTNSWLLMNIQF